MDAALITKLKEQHPAADLISLKSKSVEAVAKVTKAEVDLFRSLNSNASQKPAAMERFVRACILFPEGEELNALLQRKPALIEKWADTLLDVAGMDEEVEVKKL